MRHSRKRKKKEKKRGVGGAEISHTIKKKMKREKISMRRSTANLDTNYNWPGFFIHSTLISLRPFCVLSINPNSFPPNPHSKIDLQQRLIWHCALVNAMVVCKCRKVFASISHISFSLIVFFFFFSEVLDRIQFWNLKFIAIYISCTNCRFPNFHFYVWIS